ncbi:MAG: alpha/beta hydrolase [Proteobacteria bacterium]|nr:alpha/beta hydrolase [Pseudomonadota bacterium]
MIEKIHEDIGFIAGRWPLAPDLPTLVFISGAAANGIFWNEQVESLKDMANTIAIDLPGHGKSNGDCRRTLGDYADAIIKFVNDIKAPFPVPCGVSMGGGIVLELLIKNRNDFPAGIIINSGAKLRFFPLILKLLRQKKKEKVDYHQLFSELAVSKKSDPEKMRALIDASANFNPRVTINDIAACNAFDVREKLHEIDVPVLIVTSEDDVIIPPENGKYLKEKIKHACSVHIKDAGHLVPIERPMSINKAIKNFFDQTTFAGTGGQRSYGLI